MKSLATIALLGLIFFGNVESKASQDFLALEKEFDKPIEVQGLSLGMDQTLVKQLNASAEDLEHLKKWTDRKGDLHVIVEKGDNYHAKMKDGKYYE